VEVCEKVFVASNWFKGRIVEELGVDQDKIVVTGLPFHYDWYDFKPEAKKNLIVTIGVSELNVPGYVTVEGRGHSHTYFKKLLEGAKYMVVFKKAETFGYAVLEALASGVIVLAPPKFNYPELVVDTPSLLEFVDDPQEAVKFILSHRWDFEELRERYINTVKALAKYKDVAKDIILEVLR
jgi:glycosyltransferase involved in cell wall biosynthesis